MQQKIYRAELEDDSFEIILADDEQDAKNQYWKLEDEGHQLFNLYELDENYDIVKMIY